MKVYNHRYDAYYDPETMEWLEATCDDDNCCYCSKRPDKALHTHQRAYDYEKLQDENERLKQKNLDIGQRISYIEEIIATHPSCNLSLKIEKGLLAKTGFWREII